MSTSTRRVAVRLVWPVLAGLLLATLWVALADRGGSIDDAPAPLSLQAAEPAAQDEEPDVELALPIETYEIFLSRDPFQPLTPPPGSDGGGTDGGTDGGTGGTGTTTDGTTGTTDGTGDGCSGDGEVVCDGHVVTLVDVFVTDGVPGAQVQVDSTIYTVGVGDVFATNFLVRAIDAPCVTLAFGDDTFTLCEGERVLK
ncbi:MAG TPA: hypothetical protein VGA36_09535 [Nitriliruptorales bacterium]